MAISGRWRKWMILLSFGVLGWAYCGSLIGIGRHFLPMKEVLLIHAVGAPLGFALIAHIYFRRFALTGPFETAVILTGIVLALDLFLVAPLFERSFVMFESPLGTWIPLAGIFAASYLVGRVSQGEQPSRSKQTKDQGS